ncbi:MAG: tetratricopeptide repeat protein [Clostridia bacterium]|nr:tetratricopeptide repeat protein [Clostridia bacterium]
MKRKKVRIFVYVALALLCTAAIALFISELVTDEDFPAVAMIRTLVILGGAAVTLVRITPRKGLSYYENSYRRELGFAFEWDPSSRRRLLKAIKAYNEDRYEKAALILRDLKHVCRTLEDFRAVQLFTGLVFSDVGELALAAAAYEEAIASGISDSQIYSNLGFVHARNGDQERAVISYRNAIGCNPNNPFAHNNLAQLLCRLGRYEEAIEPAEKALSLNYTMYQAANALALAYRALGDMENSQKYFRIAVMNGSDRESLLKALENVEV